MNFHENLTDALFRHSRLATALLVALIVVLAAGIPRVQISDDSRAFFDQDNVEYLDVLAIENTYTVSETLSIMVVPPDGQAFTPETLRNLQQLTEDAWQIPYALRVDSAINHTHSFAQGDEVFVEPMLDEFETITPLAADRFRRLAMASDILRNTMLSENGDAYGITIRVVIPEDTPSAAKEIEVALKDIRAKWENSNPEWKIHTTGGILGNNLLARVALGDIIYLVPLAFLSVVVLLTFALGSVIAVLATIAVLACSTLATLGIAGWANVALTAGTAISPLAVLVLVSTSCVHVVLGTIRAAEAGTVDNPLRHAILQNLAPVTLSHVTTAFGFLCLNFAPSPPLASMGNIVAFGLLIGQLCVFILLPALLTGHPLIKAGPLMVSATAMRRFARWVLRHTRIWLLLFPVSCLVAIFGITRIDYDDNVIRYFDSRYELRQDAEAIQDRLTGLDTLKFNLQAPQGGSVFAPEFLHAVDRFATWLEAQPNVVSVISLTKIIKDLNQSMNGDDPAAYTVSDTQPGNAQLLMFYELSLPVGMDLNSMMDVDRTQTLLTAVLRSEHSTTVRAMAIEAENWLIQNEPQIASRSAGLDIAFARITQRNNAQMLYGFLTVLILVSLTLIFSLRSFRHGVLSLVPNLVPAVLAFGFWGLFIGDVNLGSTVVTTMTFGIVVDDTVHFLIHYLRGRRSGLNVQEAIEETFSVVGSSILLTSVALAMGFSIMMASGFSINQHIGLLTAVVVVFALLSDMLFLPAILRTFRGRSQ